MKRKIFISINIPPKQAKRLVKATEKWSDLPVRWVKEMNYHITLAFLGHVEDESLGKICEIVREVSAQEDIFDLEMANISLFPSNEDPRAVALVGEPSEELRRLRGNIERGLGTFVADKKSFRPHITLGKIRKRRWDELESEPMIDERFPLTVTAEAVSVMASDFGGEDSEYVLIEECPLK